jgi:uncharacterized membrane protein YcaP (DUF421 family)
MFHTMMQSMFHLQLPILEKLLRPIIVYLVLIVFLRLFGKRELAQLNPFDLVVLLSLSNTVQNAIIGDDNSVTGGVIGAFSLLAINWILMRVLYRMPKLNAALEGTQTVLITDGKLDFAAMKAETLTEEELLSALHKQSFDGYQDVRKMVLEPNGTFFIEGKSPSDADKQAAELMSAVQQLSTELHELRAELRQRNSA